MTNAQFFQKLAERTSSCNTPGMKKIVREFSNLFKAIQVEAKKLRGDLPERVAGMLADKLIDAAEQAAMEFQEAKADEPGEPEEPVMAIPPEVDWRNWDTGPQRASTVG